MKVKQTLPFLIVMVFVTGIAPLLSQSVAAQSKMAGIIDPEETGSRARQYLNDVLGVALSYPAGYEVLEDQYLSKEYGFIVVDGERNPIFDVSWLHEASPQEQDQLIAELVTQVVGIVIAQTPIQVDGYNGVMLTPVPGVVANTLIFVSANERLYTFRYYKESLDTLGQSLIASVRFYPARQSLGDLQLIPQDQSLYISPEMEAILQPEDRMPLPELEPEAPQAPKPAAIAPGCTNWSTTVRNQWTTTANGNGWSWAGPSFYGEGTHVDCNSSSSYNDYYAIDHPLWEWNSIYAPKSGTVIMAGWAEQGWCTLGRTVIIDHGGGYWTVSAHLRSVAIQVGSSVTSSSLIGYAGGSGCGQDNYYGVHLHESIDKNSLLYYSGGNPIGIYGGQGVRPSGYTYSCGGGGTYWWWLLYSGAPMNC